MYFSSYNLSFPRASCISLAVLDVFLLSPRLFSSLVLSGFSYMICLHGSFVLLYCFWPRLFCFFSQDAVWSHRFFPVKTSHSSDSFPVLPQCKFCMQIFNK